MTGRHVDKVWRHCYFSDLWPIWSNQEAGSGFIVCKTYIFINSNILFYKTWKQN